MQPTPALRPVHRQSLSDAVFEQLRDRILQGEMRPGEPLPAERLLCEALGVNRGAVREALRRLEQARLVSVRHGGTSRVLDYERHGGLDLLGALLLRPDGGFDTAVVRSVLEMRSALGADAARLAAQRAGRAVAPRLETTVASMRGARGDLPALQELASEFWAELVEGSGNVAYRLALNALNESYDRCRPLLAGALAGELDDPPAYAALVEAVRAGDGATAETRARELLGRGEAGVGCVLARLDAGESRR